VNVLILHSQVPFVTGGAEVLVHGLSEALRMRRHEVDVVALPLTWNPPEGLLTTALAWRLLDLRRFNDKRVDRVICTKYPTWAVQHDHKVLWLVHQHRQAYDLHGTALSEFGADAESIEIRGRVFEIDRVGIGECRARYTISRNVSHRLTRFLGIDSNLLYPPVPRAGLSPERFDPFILSVARLDASKRVREAVDAIGVCGAGLRLEIVGDGPERAALERLVSRRGLSERVVFHGRVDDETLRRLYNSCRAVYYAPIDEDYGYSTVEALAAGKPVITAADSGGVREFVADGVTGIVTSIEAQALAGAFTRLSDEELARELGARGPELTARLNWDVVVDTLLGD
jgi:glycosyltransferase involved in cell wall biosynthesis